MEHLFSEIIDYGIGWDRMGENAFDSSTGYSAVHYFHFVGVYFSFLALMSVAPQLADIALNSIFSDGPTG